MTLSIVLALLLHSLFLVGAAAAGSKRQPTSKNGEQASSSVQGAFDAFLPLAATGQRRAAARLAASGTQRRKLIHNGVPTGGNKYPFLVSTWVGTSLEVRSNFDSIRSSPFTFPSHNRSLLLVASTPGSLGGEYDFDNPKSLSRSDVVERRFRDDPILRTKYVFVLHNCRPAGASFWRFRSAYLLTLHTFAHLGSARFVSEGIDWRLWRIGTFGSVGASSVGEINSSSYVLLLGSEA
jgi:hypothetical protein